MAQPKKGNGRRTVIIWAGLVILVTLFALNRTGTGGRPPASPSRSPAAGDHPARTLATASAAASGEQASNGGQPPPAAPSAATQSAAAGPAYDRATDWPLSDLGAAQLWAVSQGQNVTVAVVGAGIDAGAADLHGVLVKRVSTGLAGGGGASGSLTTRAAELIAGQGLPAGSQAIVGLAPRAELLDVRVADSVRDATPDAIAEGIGLALQAHARVIVVPFGDSQEGPIAAAVKSAQSAAVVVAPIFAGGGEGLYPADADGTLAVAGVGPDLKPDGSLTPHGPVAVYAPDGYPGGQAGQQGNSYAAAYVAAAVALLWSADPALSPGDVKRHLVKDTSERRGGFGVINPARTYHLLGLTPAAGLQPATTTPAPTLTTRTPATAGASGSRAPHALPTAGPGPAGSVEPYLVITVAFVAAAGALCLYFIRRRSSGGKAGPFSPAGHAPGGWQREPW